MPGSVPPGAARPGRSARDDARRAPAARRSTPPSPGGPGPFERAPGSRGWPCRRARRLDLRLLCRLRLSLGGVSRSGLSLGPGLQIHNALPLEDATLLDDQRLRGDGALHASAPVQFGPSLGLEAPLEPSGHRHVLRLDVRVHLAVGRQHHVAVCVDLPFHLAVDTEGPRGDDGALELGPGADDRHLSSLFRHTSHPLARLTDLNVLVSDPDILPLRIGASCLMPALVALGVLPARFLPPGLLTILPPPDHLAFTASRGPAIACLIASSSSTERL